MRREKIKTALWFGADQWKALKKLASTMDRSVAQLVREAVDDLLKKYSSNALDPRRRGDSAQSDATISKP
jgi:predicted DNA-binding protein